MRHVNTLRVMGSGTSSSTPTLRCLLSKAGPCPRCTDAIANPASRNRRGNPALLLSTSVAAATAGAPPSSPASVLVDCGKSFRESALRTPWAALPPLKAILLTHFHADAINGLDDVREFSVEPVPCYCDAVTAKVVREREPHLTRAATATSRYVGALDLRPQNVTHATGVVPAVDVVGMPVDFVPLYHGADCTSMGFVFPAAGGKRVAYFSDVGRIDAVADAAIAQHASDVDVLMLDCMGDVVLKFSSGNHFNLDAAVDVIRRLRPRAVYLTGIGHTDDHDALTRKLRSAVLSDTTRVADCAYDGMELAFD